MTEDISGAVDRRVHPPLTYPGNKAKLAPTIIDHIPDHETYVEVFGGTAGVLFNKIPSRNEVINDADGDLHTFFRVLQTNVEDLQEWLRSHPYSEREYDRFHQRWHAGWRPDDDVERAGVYFFLRRASFGADMGGFRAEADGRRFSPRQYRNAIDRLPALSDRLSDVLLLNRDFEDVLRKYIDSQDVFLYMDPPYKFELHHYKDGLFDRPRFAHVLAELSGGDLADDPHQDRADWLLSVASVPLTIENLYPTVETDCIHEINNSDGAKQVQEKLVMNYCLEDRDPFRGDQQSLASFATP